MLKSILNLDGAQELNKSEQKSIKGGGCGFTQAFCNALCNDPCYETQCPVISGGGWKWVCPGSGGGPGNR